MFRNYLKIAFRNIWKNKVFSLINIIGLSIGLSASFVIGIIIYYDLTFDKFHPEGDRIYRITTEFTNPEGNFYNSGVTVPLAQALKDMGLTELKTVAPIFTTYPLQVQNMESEAVFKGPKFVVYADPEYFRTFQYTWLAGAQNTALKAPNEVVISAARATKYFPGMHLDQIMGKTLLYNDSISATISGVVANFKDRTDLVFEEFISLKTADRSDMTNAIKESHWHNTNSASQLFLKLDNPSNASVIQTVLDKLSVEHAEPELLAVGRSNSFHMQALKDMHFDPDYNTFDFDDSRASKSVLTSLVFVALFLLLLGCINFINLNTAQATRRAKEIGIRKTLGSSKKQLIFQFLGETFLLTVGAALLSLIFSKWLLSVFSDFIPKGIDSSLFGSPLILVSMALLLMLVTLLSGFYPALILSHFKPVSVLKTQTIAGDQKTGLRKYLTVFQFVIAQIFIIATLMVGKQLHYVMKKDMGFQSEAIAVIRTPWRDPAFEKKERLIKAIEAMPLVTAVTLGGDTPASFSTHAMGVSYQDGDKDVYSDLELLYGDANYFKLYGLKLLAGRLPLNDTIREYVINTTYLKKLGINDPEAVIGKTIETDNENFPIVGVMNDFNQRSLKSGINPMAFTGDTFRGQRSQFHTIHFRLQTKNVSDWPNTIAQIETVWKSTYPETDFEYRFLDDTIKQFYRQERKTSVLLQWATALAIMISCLGLLGLVIHTTERRTKEIGIRKVLGASLTQLNLLLCKEFLVLVGIAFAIAAPIAWWGLNDWLQGFAFKSDLSWWIFLLSGTAMLLIALLIIGIRTTAAANVNPVKSLRTE
tara:strand:+ start:1274 stop:3724 length:2451 start_codon:yes stop_codon:yes gene_type:complete